MSDSPLVSVVIPTYNRAHLLPDALQSVFDQTFTDYEIIVVDDGSTDDTKQVITGFSDKIHYVKQENAGSSAARNHGLKLARGRYIAFLDSDDLYLPEKLEKQVALLEDNLHIGMVHSSYYDVLEDDIETIVAMRDNSHHQGHIYTQLLYGCSIVTPSVVLRREVMEKVGDFDPALPMMQDIDYWIRSAKHHEIAVIAEPLIKVRTHAGNKPRDLQRIIKYRRYILDKNRALSPEIGAIFWRRMTAHVYYRIGHEYLNRPTPDLPNARTCFFRGFAQWPFMSKGGLLGLRVLFRTIIPSRLRQKLRSN